MVRSEQAEGWLGLRLVSVLIQISDRVMHGMTLRVSLVWILSLVNLCNDMFFNRNKLDMGLTM